jgi:hypothetical protein
MIEAVEKNSLDKRTRARNNLVWNTTNIAGVFDSILPFASERDILASALIESYIDVSGEEFIVKEGQRDKTHQVSMDEVDQSRVIADMKAVTERAKLAIHHTTTLYTLAVQEYESRAKARLMDVKEYAALVERVALAAARSEAGLAVDKEALRLVKIEAEIFKEYLARAMVEADIAKGKVDVAKANVRAVEADISAGEAEIKLIQAQTKQYMVVAEKATLQADVAMVLAEIMTKQLSAIKLDVGKAEIAAGFGYIQTKLDDMLALYDIRVMVEQLKADAETAMLGENRLLVAAEEAYESLKQRDIDIDLEVMEYNRAQTTQNLAQEQALKEISVAIRKSLSDYKRMVAEQKDAKATWAQELLSVAQKYVHKNSTRVTASTLRSVSTSAETIAKG